MVVAGGGVPRPSGRSGKHQGGVVAVPTLQLVLDRVHRTEDLGPSLGDLPLLQHEELDGVGEPRVVQGARIGQPGVGHQPLDTPAARTTPLRESDLDRLSSGGSLGVAGEDRREGADEAPLLAPTAALDLGPEDLGPPLDQPPQQRQVLAFGETVVATAAELVQRKLGEPFDEVGTSDAVDPAVPPCSLIEGAS